MQTLYLWSPYGIGQTIIFSSCGFFLCSFFPSPNLSGRTLDVYHTSTHGVALVRIYTVSQKTSHLWLAITLTHVNGFWYFFAQMLPIKYAIKRHFTMPHQITCASAIPGKTEKRKNCISPQMLYYWNLVHCLNSTSCLISSIFLTHDSYSHSHAAVWLPKSCNQCVQP